MKVAEAVGRALYAAGVGQVFGVVGSGNFHLTNAMVAAGSRFVAARHEGGAATMADAYARISGTVAALSVHQGPGLTNAMTGIAEAAKSRTPLLVLAAEVTEPRSNFYVDQEALARSVGAVTARVTSAEDAVTEALDAVWRAVCERRTVLLNLPLGVQVLDVPEDASALTVVPPERASAEPELAAVEALARVLDKSRRPVFVAGRGARSPGARDALAALAERHGALLATSAVARGLFHGDSWSLDVSGGFASPLAAELIQEADLIVGWGCALNMWTMRHGRLIGEDTTVVQVDDDASALGAHREVHLGVTGDVELTARRALETDDANRQAQQGEQAQQGQQAQRGQLARQGFRTADIGAAIAARVRWRDVPYEDTSSRERIDPRTLSIALDDILPRSG